MAQLCQTFLSHCRTSISRTNEPICQSLRKDDLKILLSVNIFENLYAVKEVKLGILVVPDYAIFNEELEWEGTGATMGGSKHCLSPAPEGQMRPPARQRLTLGPSYLS